MMNWLKKVLVKVTFRHGDQVNLAPAGMVLRADGTVLATGPQGVLVEWPRFGATWELPDTLALISVGSR